MAYYLPLSSNKLQHAVSAVSEQDRTEALRAADLIRRYFTEKRNFGDFLDLQPPHLSLLAPATLPAPQPRMSYNSSGLSEFREAGEPGLDQSFSST